MIKDLKDKGHNIFIDLKIHDIPNTARNAVKSIVKYEPDFITIHTLGGEKMMKAVIQQVKKTNIKVLGVTILTSHNQNDIKNINIDKPIEQAVECLIKLANLSGLTHIVCSAKEAGIVKKLGMTSITPAIRLASNDKHDQERVVTPQEAFANGSDFIVIGRQITQAQNPLEIYESIEKECYGKYC